MFRKAIKKYVYARVFSISCCQEMRYSESAQLLKIKDFKKVFSEGPGV